MRKEMRVWVFWGLLLLMFVAGCSLMGIGAASRVEREDKTEPASTSQESRQPPTGHGNNHPRKTAVDLLEALEKLS